MENKEEGGFQISPYFASKNNINFEAQINILVEFLKLSEKKRNYSKASQALKNLLLFNISNSVLYEQLFQCKFIITIQIIF